MFRDYAATVVDAVVMPLVQERDRLKAHIERNGIQWCMCSRADRMNERRIPRCPYHGDGMSVQRNVAEQERDEARAEHAAALAEMQRLRDNPIARHIKAERDAAIKRAEAAEAERDLLEAERDQALAELDDRFAESDHKAAKWYRKWREATR